MKFFDYKFILVLALSMVVYFVYREVEQINKRVTTLENNYNKNTINSPATSDIIKKQDMLPLPLPLPPSPKVSNETINVPISTNIIQHEEQIMGTVEEYSNEVLIYSNDMSANEQDTMMVESIVDMTKKVETETEIESDTFLKSESITSTTSDDLSSSSSCDDMKCDKNDLDFLNKEINVPVVNPPSLSETKKMSTDNLSKKKLNELQDIASSKGISIVIDGGNKKKTKVQLIQDISGENNI